MEGISAVILAGGRARRFGGTDKTNIIIEGKTIFEWITSVIEGLFGEIIVVSNNPESFVSDSRFRTASDHFSGFGPLAGIHSGLKSCTGTAAFVFAGDMPFLSREIIMEMISVFETSDKSILVPMMRGKSEPLHAIYSCSLAGNIERFIAEGRSNAVRDFFENENFAYFNVSETNENRLAFTNINSPDDLKGTNR